MNIDERNSNLNSVYMTSKDEPADLSGVRSASGTADITAWKTLLQDLIDTTTENKVILDEIREEVDRQKQRNKKQVQEVAESLKSQKKDLEDLLQDLQNDSLFYLPSDKEVLHSFTHSLIAQIDKTKQLLSYTDNMLEAETTSPLVMEKIKMPSRSDKSVSHTYLPKLFRKEHILGNWVHYFDNDTFTCQSYWDDDTFKEYDFADGKIVGEKEGTFSIDSGQIHLDYADGKSDEYLITGFSDERIEYLIHGTSIQFDYMPETLLNDFIDAGSAENR